MFQPTKLSPWKGRVRAVGADGDDDNGSSELITKSAPSAQKGAWNVRYWLFGALALLVLGGASVAYIYLIYIPFLPKTESPPPSR